MNKNFDTMSNRRGRKKKHERRIRQEINYAIATFDKPAEQGTGGMWFYGTRRVGSVYTTEERDVKGELRKYASLRLEDLPKLLQMYRNQGKIDEETKDSLNALVSSPDRTNWFMAFTIIKTYKKH